MSIPGGKEERGGDWFQFKSVQDGHADRAKSDEEGAKDHGANLSEHRG